MQLEHDYVRSALGTSKKMMIQNDTCEIISVLPNKVIDIIRPSLGPSREDAGRLSVTDLCPFAQTAIISSCTELLPNLAPSPRSSDQAVHQTYVCSIYIANTPNPLHEQR